METANSGRIGEIMNNGDEGENGSVGYQTFVGRDNMLRVVR